MLDQWINGLVIGNLYMLTAIGITQIYGVAGVVNFAHGSIYMFGAYIGWMAITWWGWPLFPAIALVLAGSALLGLLLERVAVRPFARQGSTILLLTTIAAGLILDNAAQVIWGPQTQALRNPLPHWHFRLGNSTVTLLDLFILACGVGTALLLHLFLYRSRAGWAVRATAQDREAALQMGIDAGRVSRLSFALAGAFAGLSGLLVGLYFSNIYPMMGASATLKGTTAALLGGLGNVPGAILGAYLLGIVEAFSVEWLGASYRNLVAVVLLIAVLLLKPRGLLAPRRALNPEPTAGTFIPHGRPLRFPRWAAPAAAAAAFALPLALANPYPLQVLAIGWAFALMAVSLNLISGTTGQISLGHAGFVTLGAYASAIFTSRLDLPFAASLVLSPVIAAAIGVLLCYPALRLRGQYLAIATLGLGEAISLIALNWDAVTLGPLGISNIRPPDFFGYELVSPAAQYLLALAILLAGVWVVHRLSGSHLGRALRAVREDEVAARAFGVGLSRYKSIAFGVSAFLAALAGVQLAHSYSYIAPDTFTFALSIQVLTMIILGGRDNIAGAVLGAVLLIALPESIRFLGEYRFILYGLLLIVMLRFRPYGLLNARS